MGNIKILPENIIKLIAAGEVVERPSSCVKELIENSADAGAENITVSVDGYGEVIRVFDDGVGMNEEDALIALSRHATSKISTEQDMYSISTYGFRGEALWAISSVSKITMRTKTSDGELATEVRAEAGRIKEVRKVSLQNGTEIVVRDLFFNTPARKKFLKSQRTEFAHIQEVVQRFSLSLLNINLKFIHNGDEIYFFRKGRTVEETLSTITGDDKISEKIILSETEKGNIRAKLYIAKPLERIGFGFLTFVNNRFVRDATCYSAVKSALEPLKTKPEGVLFINCPPYMFDVNVSPSKAEIRWRAQELVFNVVRNVVKQSFGHLSPEQFYQIQDEFGSSVIINSSLQTTSSVQFNHTSFKEFSSQTLISSSPKLIKIFGGIFAIVEYQGRIFIVDIHALSERKKYIDILSRVREKRVVSFELMYPVEIKVEEDNLQIFERFGFLFDREGEKILVKSVPDFLVGFDIKKIFEVQLSASAVDDAIRKFSADIACRTALRKGDKIQEADVVALLSDDFSLNFACPHGRPIAISIEEGLEEKFGRC